MFTEQEENRLISEAVVAAQNQARIKGLHLGQVVAHPDNPYAYSLDFINEDGIATVSYTNKTTGELVVRNFPFHELFDPNIAKKYAVETYLCERMSFTKGLPLSDHTTDFVQ